MLGDIPLTNHLFQIFEFACPDNRSGDPVETPSDGDLGHLDALPLRYLLDAEKK